MASLSCYLTISSKTHLLNYPSFFTPKPPIHLQPSYWLPRTQKLPTWKPSGIRFSTTTMRASIDVTTTTIRPGGALETNKLPTDTRNRTMEAVESYSGGVTIGDVINRAGLKLNEAQKALAVDTNGFLEVIILTNCCDNKKNSFESGRAKEPNSLESERMRAQ